MGTESQEQEKGRSRGVVGTWMFWLGCAVLIYVVSAGPAAMLFMEDSLGNGTPRRAVEVLYWPLACAYQKTILHKPLGMYLHLWAPELFDRHGQPNIPAK
jgi:hypothetical protein